MVNLFLPARASRSDVHLCLRAGFGGRAHPVAVESWQQKQIQSLPQNPPQHSLREQEHAGVLTLGVISSARGPWGSGEGSGRGSERKRRDGRDKPWRGSRCRPPPRDCALGSPLPPNRQEDRGSYAALVERRLYFFETCNTNWTLTCTGIFMRTSIPGQDLHKNLQGKIYLGLGQL